MKKRKLADLGLQFQRMMMETRRQREQFMQQIWEEHQRQVEEETWSLHPLEDIDERYVVKSGKNDLNWLMEKFLDDCDQVRIDRDLRNKSIEQTRLKLLEMKLQFEKKRIYEQKRNENMLREMDEKHIVERERLRQRHHDERVRFERSWKNHENIRKAIKVKSEDKATTNGKDCAMTEVNKNDDDDDDNDDDDANKDNKDVDNNDEMKNNQTNLEEDDAESDNEDALTDDGQENCHGSGDDGKVKDGQSDLDSDNIALCNDNDINNENYKERKNDFDSDNKTALRNND